MKERRYILDRAVFIHHNGQEEITPSLNAENVKDKDMFYKKMFLTKEEMKEKGVTSTLNRDEIDKVIIKDWKFDYLVPEHLNDDPVKFLCDFHDWIGKEPDRVHGYPVSKKMKEILDQFNIFPENKFYLIKRITNILFGR